MASWQGLHPVIEKDRNPSTQISRQSQSSLGRLIQLITHFKCSNQARNQLLTDYRPVILSPAATISQVQVGRGGKGVAKALGFRFVFITGCMVVDTI